MAMNKYGFERSTTITQLINKYKLVKVGKDLFNGSVMVFECGAGGNTRRIKETWLFFKKLEG